MAADEFTEVTQQGLGDNIKSSCSGAIFGLILFIGSFVLLFWNEGNAIRTAKSLEQGAANTVSVAPDRVDPANEGKPVHMTGKAQTPDTLADAEFGVSAAAIYHVRDALDQAGFPGVKIVASSGFGPAKCRVMAEAAAPIDIIGTGSYLPERWGETYATADIIEYDGVRRVKLGREFLFRRG